MNIHFLLFFEMSQSTSNRVFLWNEWNTMFISQSNRLFAFELNTYNFCLIVYVYCLLTDLKTIATTYHIRLLFYFDFFFTNAFDFRLNKFGMYHECFTVFILAMYRIASYRFEPYFYVMT